MNYQYDALAASVRLKDITSSAINRKSLHSINDNDPNLPSLTKKNIDDDDDDDFFHDDKGFIRIREGDDLRWLGYFIGRNKRH